MGSGERLREALEIIAAPPTDAPDAIGVTARNIALAALRAALVPAETLPDGVRRGEPLNVALLARAFQAVSPWKGDPAFKDVWLNEATEIAAVYASLAKGLPTADDVRGILSERLPDGEVIQDSNGDEIERGEPDPERVTHLPTHVICRDGACKVAPHCIEPFCALHLSAAYAADPERVTG